MSLLPLLGYIAFAATVIFWTTIAIRRWWLRRNAPRQLGASVEAETADAGDSPEKAILRFLRQAGKAKRHDLLPQVGLSRSSLGRLLDQMEVKGLIRQEGKRKASYYILADKSG